MKYLKCLTLFIILLPCFANAKTPLFYLFGEVSRAGDWSSDPVGTTVNSSEVNSIAGGLGLFVKSKVSWEFTYKRWGEQTLDGIINGTTSVTMKKRVTFYGVGFRGWNLNSWFSLKAGVGYYDVESTGGHNTSFPHLGNESLNYQSNPSSFGWYVGLGLNIPLIRNGFHIYADGTIYSYDDKSSPKDTSGNKVVSKSQAIGEASVGVRFLL